MTKLGIEKEIDTWQGRVSSAQANETWWRNEYYAVDAILKDIAAWDAELQPLYSQESQLIEEGNQLQYYLSQSPYSKYNLAQMLEVKSFLTDQHSTVMGHLYTITDPEKGLLATEKAILENEIAILLAQEQQANKDLNGLQVILNNASLALSDILPTEQDRLSNLHDDLDSDWWTYQTERDTVSNRLDSVTGMLPDVRSGLESQIAQHNSDRYVLVTYEIPPKEQHLRKSFSSALASQSAGSASSGQY